MLDETNNDKEKEWEKENFLKLLEQKRRFLEDCVDKDVSENNPEERAKNRNYILNISIEMDELIVNYYHKNNRQNK